MAQPSAQHRSLQLEYPLHLCPANGVALLRLLAGPVPGCKEAAGHAFHAAALQQRGVAAAVSAPTSAYWALPVEREAVVDHNNNIVAASSPAASTLDSASLPHEVSWREGGTRRASLRRPGVDYYALLGAEGRRWAASPTELRDAFASLCLEHFCGGGVSGAAAAVESERQQRDQHFSLVQQAYMVLSDPAKRREYDSIDEFDDSLPTECAVADFFKVFGPAFERNTRWSSHPAVPSLGDEGTSFEEVDCFYSFWFGFRSWREFPHPEELDLTSASNLEHLRWMQAHNAKLRRQGKQEESKRLRAFVEAAYRCDPRVIKQRQQELAYWAESHRDKRRQNEAAEEG